MKLGAYTACLHDKTLEEALTILRDLGLNSAEINAGGFIGTPHLPVEELLESAEAREKYLAIFAEYGIELTALNCNGNPLHPDPEVHHAEDLKRTIKLAGLLGIKTVITMSGLPAADPGGTRPSWTVIPWDSVYKETLDYQWNEVAVPFWKEIQELAAENDVAGRHRDAPAQPGLQPGHDEAARRADHARGRHQPRRRRDGPEPPVLAAHRPDRRRSRTSARWCSSPRPRTR